jgi:hypothetical protein
VSRNRLGSVRGTSHDRWCGVPPRIACRFKVDLDTIIDQTIGIMSANPPAIRTQPDGGLLVRVALPIDAARSSRMQLWPAKETRTDVALSAMHNGAISNNGSMGIFEEKSLSEVAFNGL